MKRIAPSAKKGRTGTKTDSSPPTSAPAPMVAPDIAAMSITDVIDACLGKVSKLISSTEITGRSLFEYYEYESDEPALCQCCELVNQLLEQARAALMPFGSVRDPAWPRAHAVETGLGCEEQRRWLHPAIQVIRSVIYVLVDGKIDHLDDVLPALRDIEQGLKEIIKDLEQVILRCLPRARRRVAR